MIKHLLEQRSEAWYHIRLGRITATSFSDLMAKKDTKGYNDLITDIAGEILTEKKDESEDYTSPAMERGVELESEAVKLYEDLFELQVEKIGFITPDEDNEFAEWIGVSPDGLIGEDGGLEIKCQLRKTHLNYIENGVLPTTYKNQVQASLWVSGRKWWDFMSYYPEMKPFIVRVFPDKELHLKYEERLRESILLIKNKIEIYKNYSFLK